VFISVGIIFYNSPHPAGLTPFLQVTGQHTLKSDSANIFTEQQLALDGNLTFLGGFHPQTQSFYG
jgi:hypothetical protein